MLDKENVEKCEFIFDKLILQENVLEYFNFYINTLGLTYEQGRHIITHNITACTHLSFASTSYAHICSKEHFVEILIKFTLCRQENIFEPIREDEKEFVKKYYNLEL